MNLNHFISKSLFYSFILIAVFYFHNSFAYVENNAYTKDLLHCAHSNVYGEYAEGGGCNVYGCWPLGGSCTVFGCSTLGECTATKCPNKIKSFQCIKSTKTYSEKNEEEEFQSLTSLILAKYPCKDWNAFGDYAEDGGCNAFGCWPPGGSCNAFGCSSQGECTAMDCPFKIQSYQCGK